MTRLRAISLLLACTALAAAPARAQNMEETSMALPALTIGFAPTYVAEAEDRCGASNARPSRSYRSFAVAG